MVNSATTERFSMSKPKVNTVYLESDLAALIHQQFANLESPEGNKFRVAHVDEGTLIITVGNQSFIINIIEKSSLS